jgi:hypothetical protein
LHWGYNFKLPISKQTSLLCFYWRGYHFITILNCLCFQTNFVEVLTDDELTRDAIDMHICFNL